MNVGPALQIWGGGAAGRRIAYECAWALLHRFGGWQQVGEQPMNVAPALQVWWVAADRRTAYECAGALLYRIGGWQQIGEQSMNVQGLCSTGLVGGSR
jgi:hypothetical protein